MKKYGLVILVALLAFSCDSEEDNSDTERILVEQTLIVSDNLYGNGDEELVSQNMVITNQNAWDALIAQLDSVNNVSGHFSETAIDFSLYTVIAVLDEIKGSGGHSLELSIMSNTENILVHVTDLAPEGNATTVITQPFIIVKISNSDMPIVFE